MKVLRYDVGDVFLAAGLGLRLRKWAVVFPGVLAGAAWWSIFGYLALLAHGFSLQLAWKTYGPMPWPTMSTHGGAVSTLFWTVGFLGLFSGWLISGAAVSRITYRQLKGDEFYSWREAWSFALGKWRAILAPPMLLFIGAGIVLLLLFLFSLLVGLWHPLAGFLFPGMLLLAVGLLYLELVWSLGLMTVPSIVAASRSEPLETLFELFSLHASQGRRSWLYTFLGGLISSVYTLALAIFLTIATLLTTWVMDFGHSGIAGTMLKQGSSVAPRIAKAINGAPGFVDACLFGLGLTRRSPYGMPHPEAVSGASFGAVLFGVWLTMLVLLLAVQFVTTFSTCQTTSYVVLRQLKDEQNLLEEDLDD